MPAATASQLKSLLENSHCPSKRALFFQTLARQHQADKKYDLAHDYYEQALQQNPHSPSLLCEMGFFFLELLDAKSAHVCLERCLDLNPEYKKAWLGLALVHYHCDDLELAWSNLERVLDIDAEDHLAQHLCLELSSEGGCLPRSLSWLLEQSKVQQNNSKVLLKLSQVYYQVGFYALASRFAERCLSINPSEQEAQLFL